MTDTINGRTNVGHSRSGSDPNLVDDIEEIVNANRVRTSATAEHDDVHADTLEGRLRLVLNPAHTLFKPLHGWGCGCGFTATWITAEGAWAVGGDNANGQHDGVYNVAIVRDGRDPVIYRQNGVTASKVIDALRLVGAID